MEETRVERPFVIKLLKSSIPNSVCAPQHRLVINERRKMTNANGEKSFGENVFVSVRFIAFILSTSWLCVPFPLTFLCCFISPFLIFIIILYHNKFLRNWRPTCKICILLKLKLQGDCCLNIPYCSQLMFLIFNNWFLWDGLRLFTCLKHILNSHLFLKGIFVHVRSCFNSFNFLCARYFQQLCSLKVFCFMLPQTVVCSLFPQNDFMLPETSVCVEGGATCWQIKRPCWGNKNFVFVHFSGWTVSKLCKTWSVFLCICEHRNANNGLFE